MSGEHARPTEPYNWGAKADKTAKEQEFDDWRAELAAAATLAACRRKVYELTDLIANPPESHLPQITNADQLEESE